MAYFNISNAFDLKLLKAVLESYRPSQVLFTDEGTFRGIVRLYPGQYGELVRVAMHPLDLEIFRRKHTESGQPMKPVVQNPGENN